MKSILLIGLGRFGRHIAEELNKLGHEVMAVDENEDRVNAVLSIVTNAQIGDSTNAEFLEALGVRNFDVCIVAISGNFQSSLETTSLLKELGAKMGVYHIHTTGEDPYFCTVPFDGNVPADLNVLAFEYQTDRRTDHIQLFFWTEVDGEVIPDVERTIVTTPFEAADNIQKINNRRSFFHVYDKIMLSFYRFCLNSKNTHNLQNPSSMFSISSCDFQMIPTVWVGNGTTCQKDSP